MKKLTTILIGLFALVAMTFGQNTIKDGGTVTFELSGSSGSINLIALVDLDSKEIALVYSTPITLTNITGLSVLIGEFSVTTDGNYCTVISYTDDFGFSSGTATVNYTAFEAPQFTQTDIDAAFANGVASVPECVQDFTQADIDAAFANGVASVPECVQDFTQSDVDAAYDDGLEAGADLTVDTDEFEAGVDAGKQTCGTTGIAMTSVDMGVNVYPNPVVSGTNITVECTNFDRVDVLTITGQSVASGLSSSVSTNDLTTGVYFLNVFDTDGNVSTTKVLVK